MHQRETAMRKNAEVRAAVRSNEVKLQQELFAAQLASSQELYNSAVQCLDRLGELQATVQQPQTATLCGIGGSGTVDQAMVSGIASGNDGLMAELVIYGRDSCGMCNNFKKECEKNNLKYKYLNIEDAAVKADMFRKDVEKIKKQFKDLDANKDGTLDFNEMKKMMAALNSKLSEVQLQKLFCQADVNGNGKVELEEFIDFVMHGKQAVAKVLQEPPQGTPTATGVRDQWKKDEAHNAHRKNHSAPPLQWMDECYLSAKKQANLCQERSAMYHGTCSGPSGRHGQNIYWCSSPGSDAGEMVYAWYQEVNDPGYNFSDAKHTPGTGHFTQVVWKGTTHVGMALSEDGRFCVANYYPAGNVMGEFASNVW
eukprot:symbB.v1.2.013978.t1/scaffold1001.1/size146904/9